MPRTYLDVIVENEPGDEKVHILAPEVGLYYRPPEPGAYLKKGSLVGLLKRVNTLFHLRIPTEIAGFVRQVALTDLANPVQYRQELFSLVPGQALGSSNLERDQFLPQAPGESDIPEGVLTVPSPTDGIFYRKPNPESPPYVQEGDEVILGQVLGLVEVMKSFNQIKFMAPDFPPKARIVKILATDVSEIKSTQVLFWLEPV
ncbi:hypothetical protein JXQ70_16040 [bacterium]|nr:hypothetical protein [bacterium]